MPESSPKPWRNSALGNIVVLGITALVVLAVVWFVGFARGGSQGGAEPADAGQVSKVDVPDSGMPAPEVGEPAPAFTARTLDGEDFDMADAVGKPVWLLFNATWCANCRAEIPDVQETFDANGEQVQILSVYVSDTPSEALAYSKKLDLTYPQVVDSNNQIAALYRVMGLPTHYFIDADGNVDQIRVGALSPTQIGDALQEVGVEGG